MLRPLFLAFAPSSLRSSAGILMFIAACFFVDILLRGVIMV